MPENSTGAREPEFSNFSVAVTQRRERGVQRPAARLEITPGAVNKCHLWNIAFGERRGSFINVDPRIRGRDVQRQTCFQIGHCLQRCVFVDQRRNDRSTLTTGYGENSRLLEASSRSRRWKHPAWFVAVCKTFVIINHRFPRALLMDRCSEQRVERCAWCFLEWGTRRFKNRVRVRSMKWVSSFCNWYLFGIWRWLYRSWSIRVYKRCVKDQGICGSEIN